MFTRRSFIPAFLLAVCVALAAAAASAGPWSFGVISDTQWLPVTPENHSVAINIVDAVNRQFVEAKVELVLQVGDLTDDGTDAALDTRAAHNRALAAAGIPFYPLRGNHEPSLQAAIHFGRAFPSLPGTPGHGGSSPPLPGAAGHTYSFVHNGVKFLLLDQFTLADGSPSGKAYTVADYQPWIDRELSAKDHQHAFVLAHKDLLGKHHKDNLFGAGNDENPDMQNAFFASLSRNGVRYYICGHDHMHYRSLVTSPDGRSTIQQIIGASDSYKFYTPKKPFSPRDRPLAQELYRIGYYIYTVDGPRADRPLLRHVALRRRSGEPPLGIAGDVRLQPQRQGIPRAERGFLHAHRGFHRRRRRLRRNNHANPHRARTTPRARTRNGSRLAKLVTTGWSPKTGSNLASDVLTLWGMAGRLGSDETDTFVLSMSFHRQDLADDLLKSGAVGILTRDADGKWSLAVDANHGGKKAFVLGPWDKSYGLGAYGIDPADNTAWAVLDHASDFAVGVVREHRR